MIELSKIRIDGGTQARAELNQETVSEYAEAFMAGAKFPAVTVFFDGSEYWLADGFHRFFGAKQAGLTELWDEITPGTRRDAILHSLGANAKHGLRRSNADKRKAVETLLADAEWSEWSSREIARRCGVSHTFVEEVRNSIWQPLPDRLVETEAPSVRTVTRNGATYQQNVAKISKNPPAQVQHEPAYDPRMDEAAELAETVCALAAENEALKDRLSVAVMPWSDEEKAAALDVIESLRSEVKRLEIMLAAVTASRDTYMAENAQMKRQLAAQARQLGRPS